MCFYCCWPFAPESYSIHNIISVVQHQSANCETRSTTPRTQTPTNTHTHTHTAAQPGIARSHALLPTTASLIHLSLAQLTQEKQPAPSLPSCSIRLHPSLHRSPFSLHLTSSPFFPPVLSWFLSHVISFVCLAHVLQSVSLDISPPPPSLSHSLPPLLFSLFYSASLLQPFPLLLLLLFLLLLLLLHCSRPSFPFTASLLHTLTSLSRSPFLFSLPLSFLCGAFFSGSHLCQPPHLPISLSLSRLLFLSSFHFALRLSLDGGERLFASNCGCSVAMARVAQHCEVLCVCVRMCGRQMIACCQLSFPGRWSRFFAAAGKKKWDARNSPPSHRPTHSHRCAVRETHTQYTHTGRHTKMHLLHFFPPDILNAYDLGYTLCTRLCAYVRVRCAFMHVYLSVILCACVCMSVCFQLL